MSTATAAVLREVVAINPGLPVGCVPRPEDDVSFLPMAAVDADESSARDSDTRKFASVSKGYTPFVSGDILVAKITPCFENCKIAQATLSRKVGYGSTEFHVIRPSPTVDSRYLLHFLRQPWVRVAGARRMTGSAGQRRVPEHFLAELLLPLPSLPEQRRIAAILDKADQLRAKRHAALAQLDTLTQSIFLDMFGDPLSNARGWPLVALDRTFVERPALGTMIPAKEEPGGFLTVRVANIVDWRLDLSDSKFVELPAGVASRYCLRDGDFLLARAIGSREHLGKAVVVYPGEETWAFDSHVMRLRFKFDVVLPQFVRHILRSPGGRARFMAVTRRSAVQFNVNAEEISRLKLPLPPLELQRQFIVAVEHVGTQYSRLQDSVGDFNTLVASLQHRAFRGEL